MTPFDGTLVWIWNLVNCDGGDYDAIAGRIKDVGARGVIVKASDGGNWFPQGRNGQTPVSEIVSELRGRGLTAVTWGYCYDYSEAAEAQRAIETIEQARPDAHVLDVEQEDEQQPGTAADATALAHAIKSASPPDFPLAYAPLPAIGLHVRLPYRQFTDAGLAMLPQLYWSALGWTPQYTVRQFYEALATYDLARQPIYPAYIDAAGARATDEDLAAFLALVAMHGVTGVSVWSYEHLDSDGWRRVAQAARAFPATTPDPCVSLRQQLTALSTELAGANARLEAVRQAVG